MVVLEAWKNKLSGSLIAAASRPVAFSSVLNSSPCRASDKRSCSSFNKATLDYFNPPASTMLAVEAGVFVASAFVLSFVYVSFLKRMVKTSSEVSREKDESDKTRKDYGE